MSAILLEHHQAKIAEAAIHRLLQRRSRVFFRVGERACKRHVDAVLGALARDLAAGSREAVRATMQALIEELSSSELTFSDLRLFMLTLREVARETYDAAGEGTRALDDLFFELVLVSAVRFLAWRETQLSRQSMEVEVERLESQLAELQVALDEKARLVDEVQQLNDELRRQITQHSNRLMDVLLTRNKELRARATPMIGTELAGCYRLERKLGEGGMGTVYEVVRLTDGTHLAAKVIKGGTEPRRLRRFIREAQLLAQVTHPNLISIYDVDFDDEGVLYIVMELAAGSLREYDDRIADLPWCLEMLRQVCEALVLLHGQGIVHRDLKPENILLASADPCPRVKLADFGIALALEDSGEGASPVDEQGADTDGELRDTVLDATRDQPSRCTGTGVLIGTPFYMAPELARGSRYALPASDMFSIGVIAYEYLCGAQPFVNPPVYSRPVPRSTLGDALGGCPGLSPTLAAELARCLDWDPDKRPSAGELARELMDSSGFPAGRR